MLVVGAGGAHAAFVLGVLQQWVLHGNSCAEWTHLAGISAGALVTGMIQQVDMQNASEYAGVLEVIRTKLCNKFPLRPHIQLSSTLNAMYSLFFSNSLYQNDLPKFIQENINFKKFKESDRTLSIGMYNQTKGRYESHVVKHTDSEEHIVKMLTASCSVPCALPPQKIGGQMFVDGGLSRVMPFAEIAAFWKNHKGHLDILACYPTMSLQEFKICENVKSRFALLTQCSDCVIDTLWNTYQRDLDDIDELLQVHTRESAVNTWNIVTDSGTRRVRFLSPRVGVYIDLVGKQQTVAELLIRYGREAANDCRDNANAAQVHTLFTPVKMRM